MEKKNKNTKEEFNVELLWCNCGEGLSYYGVYIDGKREYNLYNVHNLKATFGEEYELRVFDKIVSNKANRKKPFQGLIRAFEGYIMAWDCNAPTHNKDSNRVYKHKISETGFKDDKERYELLRQAVYKILLDRERKRREDPYGLDFFNAYAAMLSARPRPITTLHLDDTFDVYSPFD